MRQAGVRGLTLALGVLGGATQAGAQGLPQPPAAAPPAPASAAASGFTPAPVPSHAVSAGTPVQPLAASAPLAPGTTRLRLNGSVTSYVGISSDSGRHP
jgi:hypothetical protein